MAKFRFSAVVLQDQWTDWSMMDMRDAASEMTPKFAAHISADGASGDASMFHVGQVMISVLRRRDRYDPERLATAARGAHGWDGAVEVVDRHNSHVLISMVAEAQDHEAALRDATFLLFTAAAVCRAAGGLAMLWLASDTLTPSDVVGQRAAALEQGELPVLVWGNINPVSMQDPATGNRHETIMTKGLVPFCDKELIHVPLQQGALGTMIQPIVDVARQLIAEGPVVVQQMGLPQRPPMTPDGAPLLIVGAT